MNEKPLLPDFQNDGYSLLYDVSRSYYGALARKLIRERQIASLFPKQYSHKKKFQTNLEQFVYNCLECRASLKALETVEGAGYKLWVAVPLWEMFHQASRYKLTHMSHRHLTRILDEFESLGWVERIVGSRRNEIGQVTRFRPVGPFADELDRYIYDLNGNIGFFLPAEPLVMKSGGRIVEYVDNDKSRQLRESLNRYNEQILSLPISLHIPISPSSITQHRSSLESEICDCDGLEDCHHSISPSPSLPSPSSSITQHTSPGQHENELVASLIYELERTVSWLRDLKPTVREDDLIYELLDFHKHHKRVFNRGSWYHGGRYYASYQNLPSATRQWLRIGGKPVVELDFKSLHAHMLYHREGIEPEGDPYTLDIDVPRASIKRVFFVLLNSKNHQSLNRYLAEQVLVGWLDLNGHRPQEVINSMRRKHARIKHHFHSDKGIILQRHDSELATRILERITALVIHDSFIVPFDQEHELRAIMREEYMRVYKFDIPVDGK